MTRLHEIVLQYNVLYCGWKGVQETKWYRNTKLYCDRRLGAGLDMAAGAGRVGRAAGGARTEACEVRVEACEARAESSKRASAWGARGRCVVGRWARGRTHGRAAGRTGGKRVNAKVMNYDLRDLNTEMNKKTWNFIEINELSGWNLVPLRK